MNKFLLVEHGGPRKKFIFDVLKEKNLEVILACTSFPDYLQGLIDRDNVIISDTFNTVKLLSDVVQFLESRSVELSAMGTFYEHVVAQTADVASALGLICINPAAARRSSVNKLLMRSVCQKNGIATPDYQVLKNPTVSTLEKVVEAIGLPCVIKPIFGAESYGTKKIEAVSDIPGIREDITTTTQSENKEVFKNFEQTYIIEQYLEGTVVSVDGLVQDSNIMIAGVVEFVMGPEPWFVQESNYIPPRLEDSKIIECEKAAKQIIKTLGFDNCGFHCEMRLTKNTPVLIEIAARLPGGPLQPGYRQAYGFDLTSLLIDIWLGKKITLKKKCSKYVLQSAVFPTKPGRISSIEGIEEAKSVSGLWDFSKIVNEGDTVVYYPDMPIPFYYFAMEADSPAELEESANILKKSIGVSY